MSRDEELTIYGIMQKTANEMCERYCKFFDAAQAADKAAEARGDYNAVPECCEECPLRRWF